MREADLSVDRRDLGDIFGVRDPGRGVQNFKDTFCRRNIGNDLVIKVAQVQDWVPEHSDVAAKGQEGSDGNIFRPDDADSNKIEGGDSHTPA